MKYLAVIDLGSNSTRMVVEEFQDNGEYVELKRRKLDTRLAEGMDRNEGALTDLAMDRVVAALMEFEADYRDYPDIQVLGIATAAVREASNQIEFLDRVYHAVGVEIRVLTGDQEAYYDYLGAFSALQIDDAWLLDTGGASVELVGIEERMAANFISLPFGAVTLAEKFHLNGEAVIEPANIMRAQKYVCQEFEKLPWLDEAVTLPIVVLGGANRSLARLSRQQHHLTTTNNFHGYEMQALDVLNTFNEMTEMSKDQRALLLGAEANRADIIISGLLPLVELIKQTGAERIVFSASGVREGILQEYRMKIK
ncbi:exopolyphosphatase [Weissella muntiaci]|uniref:Exopolyphosphatase n=1 Tax=Weissella muntiaci TaxID=2508881 RepID=A0A6C2C6I0_9LACO|nr:exopolyphosphatase [Weissella muntiaci]TYC49551.1 exopolyphosphatase [Weissella muntiaci]